MPVEHPSDLVGRLPRWIHRRMVDALERIVRAIEDHAGRQLIISPGLNSCSTNDDESEDIVSFTEILNRIEVTIRKRRHYGNPNT
jgi:hypothetical protein